MSLVGTYIKCRDGKVYENLVYRGDDWFICFDDDEPVEIVLKANTNIMIVNVLRLLDFNNCTVDDLRQMGQRSFQGTFHDAKRAWLKPHFNSFIKPFPTPRKGIDKFDSIDRPSFGGVFYGFTMEEVRNRR